MAVAAHKIGDKLWRADSQVFTEFSDVISLFESEYGTSVGGRIILGPGTFNITPTTITSLNLEIIGSGPAGLSGRVQWPVRADDYRSFDLDVVRLQLLCKRRRAYLLRHRLDVASHQLHEQPLAD